MPDRPTGSRPRPPATLALRDRHQLSATILARGYTNRLLANDSEVALGTVAGLRSGQRPACTVKSARRICLALQVDVDLLFHPLSKPHGQEQVK